MRNNNAILTITGSDSTGGSGVQADIKTISALGGYAVSAITSITVQNTLGIQEFYDIIHMTSYVSFLGHMNASNTVMLTKIRKKIKVLIVIKTIPFFMPLCQTDPQVKPPVLTPEF